MTIAQDVQSLSPSARVEMFVLDATSLGSQLLRFHSGKSVQRQDLVWQGYTYTAYPVEINGLGWVGKGQPPKPTIRVANLGGFVTALNLNYDDLVGAKLIRKMTLAKYLDAVNFPNGANPTADPNSYFADETFYINRKTGETRFAVEYELGALFDVEGVKLPRRYIVQNVCPWVYRGPECGYTGNLAFHSDDTPAADFVDVCGKRLTSCKLRFGADAELPFGGYPSVGLIRQ